MARQPKLTNLQKEQLAILEPQLHSCVNKADFNQAKKIATQLQEILRPTGHETRLLQAKNWLYETALEAGNIEYAKLGFIGTIKKSSPRTRLNLEATALLAICFLRENNISEARALIFKAVEHINNITSSVRRKQFHTRLLQRLEEESILVGLIDHTANSLDLDTVNNEAIKIVVEQNEDQIFERIGSIIPEKSINLLKQVQDAYVLRLPAPDIKLLPKTLSKNEKVKLGERTSIALKRVAWRALCNSESDIYKAWSGGLSVVYDKKYLTAVIVAAFNSFSISITMLTASIVALAIKFGAEVFCDMFSPKSLMIDRSDNS